MTRINIGIDPQRLTDRHLLAEHREIKRIPNAIRHGKAVVKDIPQSFTLGKGHVRFFYNKLGYLLERYKDIRQECIRRKFNITDYESAWQDIPAELMQNYIPTQKDIEIIMSRLEVKGALKK
jgi:deoxyribonuclease (pyrimidine dimer)